MKRTTTTEVLREAVAFILEIDVAGVQSSSTLVELGIDSLTASQLLIEAEIRLDREVPFELIEDLSEIATIDDLAAAIERHFSHTELVD